jgi:hypothetical protein
LREAKSRIAQHFGRVTVDLEPALMDGQAEPELDLPPLPPTAPADS